MQPSLQVPLPPSRPHPRSPPPQPVLVDALPPGGLVRVAASAVEGTPPLLFLCSRCRGTGTLLLGVG